MQGVVSLDNSVGDEIHGGGTVDLDCLIEVSSHSVSSDDILIRDCTCEKRVHIYVGASH